MANLAIMVSGRVYKCFDADALLAPFWSWLASVLGGYARRVLRCSRLLVELQVFLRQCSVCLCMYYGQYEVCKGTFLLQKLAIMNLK